MKNESSFYGDPGFAVGTLEALIEAGHEVIGVVTQPDKPKGRGKTLMPYSGKRGGFKTPDPCVPAEKSPGRGVYGDLKKTVSRRDRGGGIRTDHHQRNPGNPQVRMYQRSCFSPFRPTEERPLSSGQ